MKEVPKGEFYHKNSELFESEVYLEEVSDVLCIAQAGEISKFRSHLSLGFPMNQCLNFLNQFVFLQSFQDCYPSQKLPRHYSMFIMDPGCCQDSLQMFLIHSMKVIGFHFHCSVWKCFLIQPSSAWGAMWTSWVLFCYFFYLFFSLFQILSSPISQFSWYLIILL